VVRIARNPIVRAVGGAVIRTVAPKAYAKGEKFVQAVNKNPVARSIATALPAIAGNIVMSQNDKITTETFEWDLVSWFANPAPSNMSMEINIPLTPYMAAVASQQGTGGTVQMEWDKTLLSYFPRFTHYRVKHFSLQYTGTAATTATGTAYMASSEDPTIEAPNYNEFSMMERNIKGPVFSPGFKLECAHDNDWHTIDPTQNYSTIVSSSTQRKVHWAGIAFAAFTELSVSTMRIRASVTFDFKGRNPAYSAAMVSILNAGTGTGKTIATEYSRAIMASQGSMVPQWASIAGGFSGQFPIDAGYHLIFCSATSFLAAQGAGSGTDTLVDIYNAGSSVLTSRALIAVNPGSTNCTTTGNVQTWQAGSLTNVFAAETSLHAHVLYVLKARAGDSIVIKDPTTLSDQANGNIVFLSVTRITSATALSLYNLYTTGPLPTDL